MITERPISFIGSSKEDLSELPKAVRRFIGSELWKIQAGETPNSAKPLKGFGPGVYEIAGRHDTDTYRAVYLLKFEDRIYVIHCFQKKSKSGIKLPPKDKNLIAQRLKAAIADHKERGR